MDKDFCCHCIYCTYDVFANARCMHPAKQKDGRTPIIGSYDVSCENFEDAAEHLT